MAPALILMVGAQPASAQTVPDPAETYTGTGFTLCIYKADPALAGLRNPVLFVEGMDLYNVRNQEELYRQFNQEGLIEELQDYDRDVIILNFDDANKKLSNSKSYVGEAIGYINANRSSISSTNSFTVIGISLGGLASRLALAESENNGIPHGVDTWISLDAPHEGANLPLSFQKFTEFFTSFPTYTPELEPLTTLLTALSKEAAKSMLLVHHLNSAHGEAALSESKRDGLVQLLLENGYPETCRKIAISNGSGLGATQPFEPGEQIFQWENPVLPYIDARMYALPEAWNQGNNQAKQTFIGIYYMVDGKNEEYTSYYPYSLDNAPGATGNMIAELYATLPYIDGDDFLTGSNYCAVPTVSALGIPIEYIDTDLSQHPEVLALSPFDEVYTAPGNDPVGEINTRTKSHIMRAVLEKADTDADGYSDYTEYLIGTDFSSALSVLTCNADITLSPLTGNASLNFETRPYTRYVISHTEALGEPWTELYTLTPATEAQYISFMSAMTNASGFFKVTAEPLFTVFDATTLQTTDFPDLVLETSPDSGINVIQSTE